MERKEFDDIWKAFQKELAASASESSLLDLKGRFIGKKRGAITDLSNRMKDLPPEERPFFGKELNALKTKVEAGIEEALRELKKKQNLPQRVDVTLPGFEPRLGRLHPVTLVRRKIENIFISMGYSVASGPEIEDAYHNFEALNTPKDHPSRDIQDTFYISEEVLLRTQTSPVQIRTMERRRPPVKIICPGRVFRRDDDVSHSPMFFQVEGLVVERRVSMADLKGTLERFYRTLFHRELEIRFRPSYFPFTEPSAETDLTCVICGGKGCGVCKKTGWLELGGCGMVDPEVFKSVGYDPEEFQGFAFGLGIDRIAMLYYGIDNIKHLYENDLRFLNQF